MASIGVVFSSGFFGFFAHAGFLAALRELRIPSAGYAGASSGAIIAAMAASGMNTQQIEAVLFRIRKDDFWDPVPRHAIIFSSLTLFKGYGGYLKGMKFANLLREIPVKRIEDCDCPLAIVATNLTLKKETIFTRGDLIKAVWASGAVPILFKPVEIDGSMYVDGGMVNKAPVEALADLIKPDKIIVHFIASDNMGNGDGSVSLKEMTPWHIYQLAVNISRHDTYKRQCDRVNQKGIEIIEIDSTIPSLGPNKLKDGSSVYHRAKEETKRILAQKVL